MNSYSNHLLLVVGLLLGGTGCIDFDAEKDRFCRDNPTQCASAADGGTGAERAKWTPTSPMKTARAFHTATLLANNSVLIVGGSAREEDSGDTAVLRSAETYDPFEVTWHNEASTMSEARRYHTATLLPGGAVLVAGGETGRNGVYAVHQSAEVYDRTTGGWSDTAPMSFPRSIHTASELPDGKVLVVGGRQVSSLLATAEVYDPGSKTWRTVASMKDARFYHTQTVLLDGTVLVTGGLGSLDDDKDFGMAKAEIYDPRSNTWRSIAPMSFTRAGHTATRLPDGRVLVVGGRSAAGAESRRTAEVYDPASGQWTRTGPMTAAHSRHQALLLKTKKVLVSGAGEGEGSQYVMTVKSELYDPSSNTWSSAADMVSARESHTMTELHTDQILVAGGLANSTSLHFPSRREAELYTP